MNDYFKAVTLGAFTWKNEERIALLFGHIRKQSAVWLLAHFLLLTFCINFPMTFVIARLTPFQADCRVNFSYIYQNSIEEVDSEFAGRYFSQRTDLIKKLESVREKDLDEDDKELIECFDIIMYENNYNRNITTPVIGILFGFTLIIQAVFYLCAVFFLGISRLNMTPISFRDRMGLAVFSSTLPALLSMLFGLYLPTVHVIIFYCFVMLLIFQRSKLFTDK